ncbi:MAG TPA: hypothetical protein VGO98_02815 [Candidatus Saccharimonadales bacterium]|jgi:hypothetical protein|nr:hypothetical protein [Candidatus Saccharimonadales bacterium]
MSHSPEKTTNNELQSDQTFDLSRVAIDHVTAPNPQFQYHEFNNSTDAGEYRVGIATIGDMNSSDDAKSATSFAINTQGGVEWSTSDKIALVVAREDGNITELGSDEPESGVIQDLNAQDEIYVISKDFAKVLRKFGQFNKEYIASTMTNSDIPADVVRVAFADTNMSGRAAEADTESDVMRRQKKNRIRDQKREKEFRDWLATLGENDDVNHDQKYWSAARKNNDVVTPVNIMQAFADDEALQAQIEAAKGYSVTDKRHRSTPGKELELYRGAVSGDTSSLGISDAVQDELKLMEKERLAAQVEKYTQKVASYEELATEALARRMKGRLFKAPKYKTQGEREAAEQALKDSGKEKSLGTKVAQVKEKALDKLQAKSKKDAKLDDDYMHLLEGFSRALDGALMKQWLAEGHSDEEVSKMLYEHQQTRQEARAARNHDELRKGKIASFLDKYANMPKGKKIAVTIGAAGVVGAVGLVAGGALGVAGAVGLAGAKVGKTYLQQRAKLYEVKRDESMPGPDRAVSVANGKVSTKLTAAEQVFAGRRYDEAKREKAIKDADRNKKLAVGLAAASIGLIGAGAIAEHGDNLSKVLRKPLMPNIPTEVGIADGEWVSDAPVPEPAPEAAFSIDAATVMNGEGWYQTIQETTGVTDPAQQAAILQKIGPSLQEKGWAYPMNDGTWGISRPGTLPKDVLELIKNSR